MNILLNKIGFSHALVQISSAAVTYTLKLSSCLVIDIGASKVSITCVEEGVAILHTAVMLPVGFYDVLLLLKSFFQPILKHPDRIETNTELTCLFNLLNTLNTAFFEKNPLDSPDRSNDTLCLDNYEWDDGSLRFEDIRVSRTTLQKINTLPFTFTRMLNPCFSPCSVLNSEPDDPFDDLYMHLTNPGKKVKKQVKVDDENVDTQQEVKKEEPIQVQKNESDKIEHPEYFESLAEAVWWCLDECGKMTTKHLKSQNSDSINRVVEQDLFAIITGEECRRRLLKNVVLVGGGSAHKGIRWLESWLARELKKLAGNATSVDWISGGPSIEVRCYPQQESAENFAWLGGTLMAHTSCISEASITASDWNKNGSRTLRERALFRW
ncbi:hypothetical protein Ciccas_008993 [Cichlidogyrus casuarinus]|uniref:Actin-related protein 10 n=1 Tax=Cichlidogyrus casuarinus TaxID=1844966 RepID=A0ABD2PYA7_9PLAT